jgi:hypothetical protein
MKRMLVGFSDRDVPISVEAVALRKATRDKLPDAIMWATASVSCRLLVTRNSKVFPPHFLGFAFLTSCSATYKRQAVQLLYTLSNKNI